MDNPLSEFYFAKSPRQPWFISQAWVMLGLVLSASYFLGFFIFGSDTMALVDAVIMSIPLLAVSWVVLFLFRKRMSPKGTVWNVKLYPDHIVVGNTIGEDWQASYDEIEHVEARYGDILMGYDRLGLFLRFSNGAEAQTGRCRCPGEEVEAAARAICERIFAVSGKRVGSEEWDRTVRVEQVKKLTKMQGVVLALFWLLLAAGAAYTEYWNHLEGRARTEGVEGRALVLAVEPAQSYTRVIYAFLPPRRMPVQSWAFFPSEMREKLEGEATIPIKYLEDDPSAFFPVDALPFPPLGARIVFLAIVAVMGAGVILLLLGWQIAYARKKFYLLRPGEIEDDRIKAAAKKHAQGV